MCRSPLTEKAADLEELIAQHYQRHQPASGDARVFVDDLIYFERTRGILRVGMRNPGRAIHRNLQAMKEAAVRSESPSGSRLPPAHR